MLAELLAEDRRPPAGMWAQPCVSSRMCEYETWVRLHAMRRAASHGEPARALLGRLSMLELAPAVLERALEPCPAAVRALDALHLASALYLRSRRVEVELATYDARLAAAAAALGLPLAGLSS